MGVLNNSWLLLVAIIYGAYIAAILLVVFGVIAFIPAVAAVGWHVASLGTSRASR